MLTNKDLTSATNTYPTSLANTIIFSETGNDAGIYHSADGELGKTCNGSICALLLNSEIDFYSSYGLRFEFLNNSGDGDIFRVKQNQGGGGQYIYLNTTMAYGIVSDHKIKTNISDIDDRKVVKLIKKLAPNRYKIERNDKDECIGFLV